MPSTAPAPRPVRPSRALRYVIAAVALLAAVATAYYLLAAVDLALALWERLQRLPDWVGYLVIAVLAALAVASVWLILRLLLGGRQRRVPRAEPIDRSTLERRLERMPAAAPLRGELLELDRRRSGGEVHVALFGEVSTGKSSLLRALAPHTEAEVGAAAGTTRTVNQARGELPDGRALQVADVPGSNEAGGAARADLARDEAARAHALVFVADGDLSRAEDGELRALAATRRPLLLALNQSDRYDAAQRRALLDALTTRYRPLGVEVVAVSAGGSEEVEREWPDGRRERIVRERPPQVEGLQRALARIVALGAERLEPAREVASLQHLDRRLHEVEISERATRSEAIVRRYTRRAMVGAMAAVAPGSDLVIQGALATAMVRELAALHEARVREIDLDGLLARAGSTVRSSTAIVLAIAGNALKAFPGVGTLSGGLVHTLAYGLIFDSLGRALAQTLAAGRADDREATLQAFHEQLERPGSERVQALARLAWEAWREGEAGSGATTVDGNGSGRR
jgi:uncharacterized protein